MLQANSCLADHRTSCTAASIADAVGAGIRNSKSLYHPNFKNWMLTLPLPNSGSYVTSAVSVYMYCPCYHYMHTSAEAGRLQLQQI